MPGGIELLGIGEAFGLNLDRIRLANEADVFDRLTDDGQGTGPDIVPTNARG